MKTKERIKNLLIIVLLCGAFYLTYATWYFDSPVSDLPLWQLIVNPGAYGTGGFLAGGNEGDHIYAIRPLAAAVKTDSGRFGAPYGNAITSIVYDKTSLLMAEALGSASNMKQADENEWKAALSKNGVFYDFRGDVLIDSLSGWLDTGRSLKLSETARYMHLCIDKDAGRVFLYFKSMNTGRIIRFDTALNVDNALSPLSGITGNGCGFAFELAGDFSLISPETLIVPDTQSPPTITGYNPFMQLTGEKLQSLFKTFRMNSYNIRKLNEKDGTQVFIEDVITLRVAPGGVIYFTDTGGADETQLGVVVQSASGRPADVEYLEAALKLSQSMLANVPGEGSLYLMDLRHIKEQDEYVALFGISIEGIPVDMPDTGFFARVVFRGKKVHSAVFNMRYYESTAETAKILPEKLAVAAMAGAGQSGELNLRYADKGAYPLFPGWHIRTGNKDGADNGMEPG